MYYQSFYPYQPYSSMKENESYRDMNPKFFSVEEGFLAGNIFKNEYMPYKNYRIPKVTPKNERDAKLMEVMALYDYRHDLSLYLDVYPNNQEALSLFNEINSQYKKERDEFVNKFGPLSVDEASDQKGMYNFVTIPSPWLCK